MRLSDVEREALRQSVVAMKRCQRECGGNDWEPYISTVQSLSRRLAAPGPVVDEEVTTAMATLDRYFGFGTTVSYVTEAYQTLRAALTAALERKDHE